MPISKNTWNKGLNSDLSKLKSTQDSYLSARNIRVITEDGNSTLAIQNIKGNEFSFSLPAVEATYKFDFTGLTGFIGFNFIRGIISDYIPIDNVEQKSNGFIANELNAAIQDPSFVLPGKEYLKFYYNKDYLVFYDFRPQSSSFGGLSITATQDCITEKTERVSFHTILGWGYYNDNLVLISCNRNSNNEDPENTEGFIWDAKYINTTNTIENSDGDYLNPLYHLKYAGKLNLSRQYAINSHLKCRYESNEIARLVWTDWNQALRTCNLLEPQIWATPEELFSYIPQHIPQKPVVRQLISGGILPTGKYQYFYQLYSSQGAVSTYSPVSNLVALFPGNLADYTTTGAMPGINSQKSVQVSLINLDTNYDSIRIGYVVYQIPDFPEAFFFDERPVPDSGEIIIVHNGNENDIPVDSTAIANLNRPPETFKTINVAKNRLFAANAKTTFFDPVFDARAYRFKSNQTANLYDSSDSYGVPSVIINSNTETVTLDGNIQIGTTFYNRLLKIEDTRDLTNPFNDENPDSSINPFSNGDWEANSQFKYKFDGTTIGGEGPNISYQFITEESFARIGGLGSFVTDPPYIRPDLDYNGEYAAFSDTYTYPGGLGNAFNTMKSPLYETLFTGYSRGEVYRFGIVFFDKYGFPSYTYWIGDIKFPFTSDDSGGFGLSNLVINEFESVVVTLDLGYPFGGYSFTITLSGDIIYSGDPISDWDDFVLDFNTNNTEGFTATNVDNAGEILFTKITSDPIYIYQQLNATDTQPESVFGPLLPVYPAETTTLLHDVKLKQLGIQFSLDTSSTQFQAIKDEISGWSYVRVRRDLNNRTRLGTGYVQPMIRSTDLKNIALIGFNPTTGLNWSDYLTYQDNYSVALQSFHAPNFFNRSAGSFIANDYIRFLGRTFDYGQEVNYRALITSPVDTTGTVYPRWYIASNDIDYNYSDAPTTGIGTWTDPFKRFPLVARAYSAFSTNENFIPTSALPNQQEGSAEKIIPLAATSQPNYDGTDYSEWGNSYEILAFDNNNDLFNNIAHPDTYPYYQGTPLAIYIASYERFLTGQYGGSTRASRYGNEYILTNHFMPYNKLITGVISNQVYGGDTWVTYYDYQRSNVNYKAGSGWDADPIPALNTSVAVFFPAECNFNSEFNTVYQHASVRKTDASGTDSITSGNYIYNQALSQENTTNIFVSKAFNQTNVKTEPHTIYGSEPKLDNERLDSWRSFLVNNALAVNGNYGEINSLIQFKDKLIYYQNDAVGIAAVDERVLANEGDSTQTQLGTGTLLQRFDYISTETGSKHSFAVVPTGSSIYHYDAFINKMFKYSISQEGGGMQPMTDIKGLSGFFRSTFYNTNLKSTDKILALSRVGISAGYNSEYNTVYFTYFCKDENDNDITETIAYNELLDAFESFYDFKPSLYLNMRKRFLSIEPVTSFKTYIHNIGKRNTFYDVVYDSEITFRVNENSDFVKTFDNFQVNTEVILNNIQLAETITRISILNDYQIVTEKNANFTQKIRSWRLQIPRDDTNPSLNIKPRISDKYMDVTFKFNTATLDKQFILHDVLTEYSMRSKILPK